MNVAEDVRRTKIVIDTINVYNDRIQSEVRRKR